MFESLAPLDADPILGLMAAFREDPRAEKIDLGVGVYRDGAGRTPIMAAVHDAEQHRFDSEDTKAYIGPPGTPGFNALTRELMFGRGHAVITDGRVAGVQTPGGCGALRVGASQPSMVLNGSKRCSVKYGRPATDGETRSAIHKTPTHERVRGGQVHHWCPQGVLTVTLQPPLTVA